MRNPRYPGPKPFQAQEHALFFGRDKEVGDLYRLVGTNKIVVLFGKSGYGKSSLLQAGLMPQLVDSQWLVVQIRFGLYDKRQNLSLCDLLKKQLDHNEKLKHTEEGRFLSSDSLWHEFKKRHDETKTKTVLIFDQFEEFFSYPVEQQEAFQREIADVLYTAMPQSVVDAYENDTFERQSYLATPMDVRALFAIRADRLSLLHSLKNHLPAILYARYELKGLKPEQAREAIEKPAAEIKGEFDSPPFAYEPEALDCMTEQLSKSKVTTLTEPQVEAVQLQIICQYIENKIRRGNLKSPVTKANLPEFDAILENYYRQQIADLDPTVQYPARIIVEEKLISGQLEDGSARRATVDGSILAQELSVDESLLMILVDAHLLRREPNSVGGYSYEICHDTLLEPILTARKERQTEEARIAEIKRKAEEDQKLAEERRFMQLKIDEEKRKRLFASRLAAVFIGIAILVIGLAVYSFVLYKKAKVNENVALIGNYLMRNEPSDALSYAYSAYEENETPQTEKALGDAFYAFLDKSDGCIVQKIETPKEVDSWIKSAAFTEGGHKLEIQYDTSALVWDLKTGIMQTAKSVQQSDKLDSVSLFDGKLTVKRTDTTSFVIEDKRQNPVFKKEYKTENDIMGVGVSPDGTRVLIIHRRNVRIWFWQAQNMAILRGHESDVNTAVFSPNNQSLLTTSKDGKAMLWNRKGDALLRLSGHNDEVRSAIFSNDGLYVITASRDRLLRVWQMSNGDLVDTIQVSDNPHRLAMTTDGLYVLVTLEYDSLQFFSFSKGKLHKEEKTQISQLNWQPYMKEAAHLPNSDKITKYVVSSYDGQLTATISKNIVEIFNSTGKIIGAYKNDHGFSDVSFSPDNQYFIVAFGSECAVLPLPTTVHKWLITNGFPKIQTE